MASIILSSVGATVGSSIGGSLGGFIGGRIGNFAGGFIDGGIFGSTRKLRDVSGPRLSELGVQASTYGKMIPIVYGSVRIAGNVIWSRPIKETVTTTTTTSGGGGGGKGGGGGRVSQTTTTYSYSVSMAIAICEGPLDQIVRIWADAKQLDFSQLNIRVYDGNKTQTPDSFIQSFEGADSTPAYRGLAYVVIEDFQLADYGNRIPNFTFEVKRKVQSADYDGEITEHLVKAITLIPGAGEFVYDTLIQTKIPGSEVDSEWVQAGNQFPINMHNVFGTANVLLSLDQMAETFPNLEWVSVVVAWFGDSLDAGDCIVKPGVEYQVGGKTTPSTWQVSGFTRDTARLITQIDGSPQYGGTPDDASLVHLLTALKDRGYNVMLYPMLFMDTEDKPWRGELTGSSSDVSHFFTKVNGFNDFINHYATLGVGKIDAFVIGSELVGLTKVTDAPGSYPAVDELIALAADAKFTLGGDVIVTYAADWSEYHHTDGGWYNLDPLWACADIDVVGTDAYFPIKDNPNNTYNIDTLIAGWTEGEGYDYYYTDPERTTTASLASAYAWKDIAYFWGHTHTNPDASTTDWTAEMKPIWFTEFGFPSVDNAPNQPNVFYDPTSSSSAFPYHSRGRVDFSAQRAAITATLHQWEDSSMVEQMFLWTWDARPYPYWPDLQNVWSDGSAWDTGHWVQGKFGTSSLAAVITDLCHRAGLDTGDINISQLAAQIEGYVIVTPQSIRACIEQLEKAYLFDSAESDYTLTFIPRGQDASIALELDELAIQPDKPEEVLQITRQQEIELPKRVNVVYLSRLADYQPNTQYAERAYTESKEIATLDIPVVISDQHARNIADITLYSRWVERHRYAFLLPIKYATLEPGDVVQMNAENAAHQLRIKQVKLLSKNLLFVDAVAEDASSYDFYSAPANTDQNRLENQTISGTELELLDIPALPSDDVYVPKLRIAAAGLAENWRGAALFRSDDNGASYNRMMDTPRGASIGITVDALGSGVTNEFDETSEVTIQFIGDVELESVTELAVLNGANAMLIGGEIIQFQNAELLAPSKYKLTRLLRGRLGTDHAIGTHTSLERTVLLDSGLVGQVMSPSLFNLSRLYKGVSVGDTLDNTAAEAFTYTGVYLKPYSPVSLVVAFSGSDITLIWIRRTRGQGEWQDGIDVPLNEDSERYEVDILDGSTLKRTISAISPGITYTIAQQTADFGGAANNFTFRVSQLSAQVGRGYTRDLFYSV